LDKNLLIRRYTPTISNYINVLPLDLDRPFKHINHDLLMEDFLDKIENVNQTATPYEGEVHTRTGNIVLLRIHPYITMEGKAEGVVLTLVDITAMYSTEQALRTSRDQQQIMNSAVIAFFHHKTSIYATIDSDFHLTGCNSAFKKMMISHSKETISLGQDLREIASDDLLIDRMLTRWTKTLDGESLELNDTVEGKGFILYFWPLYDKSQRISGGLMLAHDETLIE
jgi:hypothetical protein